MNNILLLAVSVSFLAGCETLPAKPEDIEEATLSKAVNAVKCNLAHYFITPEDIDGLPQRSFENFLNERFTVGKVDVELGFAQTIATSSGGKLGLTIPIGGVATVSPSGGISNKVTAEGSFTPKFTFKVIDPLKKDPFPPASNPNRRIPKESHELETEAEEFVGEIKASLDRVCHKDNTLQIVFPEGLGVEGSAFSKELNDRGLALTSFLIANKNELDNIEAGGPKVTLGDFVVRTALTAAKTEKAGVEVSVLIVSFGLSTQTDRSANFVIKLTFDLVDSDYTGPVY